MNALALAAYAADLARIAGELARAAADGVADPGELLPLAVAAKAAATSPRVLREAVRSGALPAVGRQRDRAVRRGDLATWIESRRSPVARVEEGQKSRVEARLARRRGRSA